MRFLSRAFRRRTFARPLQARRALWICRLVSFSSPQGASQAGGTSAGRASDSLDPSTLRDRARHLARIEALASLDADREHRLLLRHIEDGAWAASRGGTPRAARRAARRARAVLANRRSSTTCTASPNPCPPRDSPPREARAGSLSSATPTAGRARWSTRWQGNRRTTCPTTWRPFRRAPAGPTPSAGTGSGSLRRRSNRPRSKRPRRRGAGRSRRFAGHRSPDRPQSPAIGEGHGHAAGPAARDVGAPRRHAGLRPRRGKQSSAQQWAAALATVLSREAQPQAVFVLVDCGRGLARSTALSSRSWRRWAGRTRWC